MCSNTDSATDNSNQQHRKVKSPLEHAKEIYEKRPKKTNHPEKPGFRQAVIYGVDNYGQAQRSAVWLLVVAAAVCGGMAVVTFDSVYPTFFPVFFTVSTIIFSFLTWCAAVDSNQDVLVIGLWRWLKGYTKRVLALEDEELDTR